MDAPAHLGPAGRSLWDDLTADHDLDAVQVVTLEAACVQRDRLVQLAESAGRGDLAVIRQERDAALAMTRLLAAMRLPDAVSGKRPQGRQIRGVQQPTVKAGSVSSIERARSRSSAS